MGECGLDAFDSGYDHWRIVNTVMILRFSEYAFNCLTG